MKHRYEDDIIQLAFGELDGEPAEKVRRLIETEPAARRVYETYAAMASGLRRLDVPEHQLSVERLRERILRDGLKRRPNASLWRLVWMPVAAGLFALAITSKLDFVARGPSLVVGEPSGIATKGTDLQIRLPSPSAGAADAGTRSDFELAEPTILAVGDRPGSPAVASPRGPRASVTVRPLASRSEEPLRVAARTDELEAPARSFEAAVLDAAAESGENSLVIISLETDSDTGARKAVEVPSASNVLVGG